MNKKSMKKVGVILLVVIMLFSMSMTAFAAYVGPFSSTFTSSTMTNRYSMDGKNLAYEYSITNSNSPHVNIVTYVDGVKIDSRNVSGSGKADWLDMKSSGNHTVQFMYSTASAGQFATVELKTYSWN